MARQGITSFSYDPNSRHTISDAWCEDLKKVAPAGGPPILIRTPIVAVGADNALEIDGYQGATERWTAHGFSAGAVLPPEFDRADKVGECPNATLGHQGSPLLNPYIAHFAGRAEDLAFRLAPHGLTTYWVWNEPNINGRIAQGTNCPPGSTARPGSLSPANFAALLYQGCQHIKAGAARANTKVTVYAGALSVLHPSPTQGNPMFDLYLDAVYSYLHDNGVRAPFPWDGVSLNMEGLWSEDYAGSVARAIRNVRGKYGDESPIVVSEWGHKAQYANQAGPNTAQATYDNLRTTFDALYFFEHGWDGEGYGATKWGVANNQFVPTGQTEWYPLLQSLWRTS